MGVTCCVSHDYSKVNRAWVMRQFCKREKCRLLKCRFLHIVQQGYRWHLLSYQPWKKCSLHIYVFTSICKWGMIVIAFSSLSVSLLRLTLTRMCIKLAFYQHLCTRLSNDKKLVDEIHDSACLFEILLQNDGQGHHRPGLGWQRAESAVRALSLPKLACSLLGTSFNW